MKIAGAELLRRLGPWALLTVAVLAYYPRFIKDQGGMQLLYPDAAVCLLHNAVMQDCQQLFTYPPFFAFVMIPFAWMPLQLRQVVGYLVTIAAVMGSFKLSEMLGLRLIGDRLEQREIAWVRCLAVLLSSKFVLAVLESQAYDALVLIFMVLGAAALSAGRQVSAGSALAIATALKATPLVFLPYLVVKRRFVAAVVFLIVLLVACYLPDMFFTPRGGQLGYFNTWLREVALAGLVDDRNVSKHIFWLDGFGNHSLAGAVRLAFLGAFQSGIDRAAHAVEYQSSIDRAVHVVDLTFVAIVGVLLLLSPRKDRFVGIDASILAIATLMLSPMTSRSHYVSLILPYTVLTTAWMRDGATRVVGAIVLSASFFFATATSNDLVGQGVTDWSYQHSFLVIGALVLLVYLAVIGADARLWPQRFERPRATTVQPVKDLAAEGTSS